MIAANTRPYNFFSFGAINEDGMPTLSADPVGTVKMAIYPTTQSIGDNIKYRDATYIGLTNDANVDDTYVIEYGAVKLKVLYVIGVGRLKQVFMAER